MVDHYCTKGCCKKTFCPLKLGWARTIHNFQGCQAGPINIHGEINDSKRIICDLGGLDMERLCPGLLYTALSRATTLGDNRTNSAIYFNGKEVCMKRFLYCTKPQGRGKLYEKIEARNRWMKHLKAQAKNWSENNKKTTSNENYVRIKNRLTNGETIDIQKIMESYSKSEQSRMNQ